jgi:hypothetical protein
MSLRGSCVSRHRSGNGWFVDTEATPPGPLEADKRGDTSDPRGPQPEAAEVESARLLANQARDDLRDAGLSDEEIRRLADDYIALDRGEDLATFIDWARSRPRRGSS